MKSQIYTYIVKAIKNKELKEPFTAKRFKEVCEKWKRSASFLWKHRRGNPGGNSELFERILSKPRKFKLTKPLRKDLINP